MSTNSRQTKLKPDMRVQVSDHTSQIRVLTLDHPPVNALDNETMEAFSVAIESAMASESIRAVVVTGGGKVFAAGADLNELARCGVDEGRALVTHVKAIMAKLRQGPKPVIAAINGLAAGGGLELAIACDIRIADPAAGLGLPEVTLGVLPGSGGTQILPRLIGIGRALDMMLSGMIIPAAQGLAMGLVDRIAAEGAALDEAIALAEKIACNAPLAVTEIKAAAYAALSQPIDKGLAAETEGFARLCATEDKAEGIAAFKAGRSPVYQGK